VETAAVSGQPAGVLYVVSTPIGNLGDITRRAVETLRACDIILAEDTRRTRILLRHEGIDARVESLREHTEARVSARVVRLLQTGASAALVADAGTPLVNDPGARLLRQTIDSGLRVVPIPGASAVLAAIVVAGLPAVPFTFFGFFPRKGRERSEMLASLATLGHTAVCFESPERVAATLAAWTGAGMGDRPAVVARVLTKRFEEARRGTVRELAAYHDLSPPRGEVVLVLGGATVEGVSEDALADVARTLRQEGVSAREVARRLSAEHGAPRNVAYRLAHET
jgi:16S rRNA (cytidine1402-2'-O)-methyltransferase